MPYSIPPTGILGVKLGDHRGQLFFPHGRHPGGTLLALPPPTLTVHPQSGFPPAVELSSGKSGNEHLHRCSQCKIAKYCGKSCQKEAWLDHRQECRCLKSVEPNFPPDSVRLAGRIVFKLLRQSVWLSERLYSFSDLQSNTEQLCEEMKDGLRHLAQTLQLYLKTEIQDASHLPPAIDFFQIFAK
ncbi:PREDICTED: histone-lysine N-methyltransferase SMYD3-like, partial [Cariama cristata]|uniref:histone-lysine N-methyltransferase SMYD3-like n=1 Tax=Cariama cristata TaxID=54380 RepID=UPI000520DBAF